MSQFDSINDEVIAAAATYVANVLDDFGFAEVTFEPGDATLYRIIVLPRDREVHGFGWENRPPPGHDAGVIGFADTVPHYLVVLATGFGCTYPWHGQAMHGDYCAQKWSSERNGGRHTGEVVARFLTALSKQLPQGGG